MADLVPVRMGDCRCPGSPHSEGDFAYLKPKAGLDIGLAVHQIVNMGGDLVDVQVRLGRAYLRYGIVNWDLLDENGRPQPVQSGLDELSWAEAEPLADAAADLYGETVLAPLAARIRAATLRNGTTPESSANGRTAASTSRKTPSSTSRRRRS